MTDEEVIEKEPLNEGHENNENIENIENVENQENQENVENQENQENHENIENQENHENVENQENQENHENIENQENQENHENIENIQNNENNENIQNDENIDNNENQANQEVQENQENHENNENQVNQENQEADIKNEPVVNEDPATQNQTSPNPQATTQNENYKTYNNPPHQSDEHDNYAKTEPNFKSNTKPLLDPQLISKRTVAINNSTSKQMYKFGTAKRFKELKQGRETFFYNLPTVFDMKSQSAAFGYGTKSDFTKNNTKGKTGNYYDIPREFEVFRKNSPQYSFGRGRDMCKRQDQLGRQDFPGPGNYNPGKDFGNDALKFSLFGRTWDNKNCGKGRDIPIKSNDPGPGQYGYMNINKYGKYPSSTFENSRQSQFLRTERFNYKYSKYPPPNAYNLDTFFNGTGKFFSSKYESQVAKTMGDRPKQFYFPKASPYPGPGAYNLFSDFSGFAKGIVVKKKMKMK